MPQNNGIDQPSYELTKSELIELRSKLSPSEFFVLILLRIESRGKKHIEISDISIGEQLGYCARQVKRALLGLEEKGLIDNRYATHSITLLPLFGMTGMSKLGQKCPGDDKNVQEAVQNNYPESTENSLLRTCERTRARVRPSGYIDKSKTSLSILNCNEFIEFCQERTKHYTIPIVSWVDYFNPRDELKRLRFEQFVAEFEKREREKKIEESPQEQKIRARQQEFLAKCKRSKK